MKKIPIILGIASSLLTSFNLFSQDTLKYTDLQSGAVNIWSGSFKFYQSKDGYVYKVGDRLKIGIPSSNKTFAYIEEGDGVLIQLAPLTVSASGQDTEIKKILISGTKSVSVPFFRSVQK